jgi:hypothetical protein
MKYLTIDSDNKILGWNEDAHTEGCIETDSVIPEYTDTQSLYWEGGTVVAKDDSEKISMKAEYDAQEYARNRKTEYPPMADQLDYMFHNGFDKWKEDIVQPVKDKYPKPE